MKPSHMSSADLDAGLDRIWQAMDACMDRGLACRACCPAG